MPFAYANADLHGRYDLLSEAVTKIVEHSKSDRPATIITLGDYVDRGPKSRQVIERLMDWRSPDLKRDRLVEHQKDQGTARERFHHGQQNRSHALVISIRGVPVFGGPAF